MPIFEYRCQKCGVKYEKIVFNREAPPPECPGCGSAEVEKLISAPGSVGVGLMSTSSAPSSCPSAASGQCGSGFS